MSFFRSKRGAAMLAVVVLLALFLVRPGANRLRSRIASSVSLALGRPVEISSVSVRLLPRPGFQLQNFVVHEDPAFGAEPTLRASNVMAALRLTSLLRGRLEIARLSLTEPSVNLVRNSAGLWNLANVLERADQMHVAPTGKSKTEVRPGFPYIEGTLARINFKSGQEKKPYTLTNADFSVWQDSEDAWGMRLKAQPVRTDFNLSDTGTIQVQGSWQRAASLRDTPLQFALQWDRSQLGQATTLFYGSDQGWRGTVTLSVNLTGTAADLAVRASASVDDFRRYDLDGGAPLRLAAQCSAHYAPFDHAVSALSCRAPVAGGLVLLDGGLSGYNSSLAYSLHFAAQDVPMQSMVVLARHTKKNIPEDLLAAGMLRADFQFQRQNVAGGPRVTWDGQGGTHKFAISSLSTGTALFPDKIPFSLVSGTFPRAHTLSRNQSTRVPIAAEPHLEVGPFKLSLGRPAPVSVNVSASRSEYALTIQGEAGIQRLLQLARSIGLPAAQPNADGIAKIDLEAAGTWSAFSPVTTIGQAQLRAVRAEIRGLNQPLEIASANVALTHDEVEVTDVIASLAGSTWRGSLALPRQCSVPAQCLIRFNLRADTIATDEWNDLLRAGVRKGPWYRLFASNPQAGNSYLLALHASGRFTAGRLVVHKLAASQVSAKVELENGILRLSDVEGSVLGGSHFGDWSADFTRKPPEYRGSGNFRDVDLEKLSLMMHDGWITGTGSASYRVTASGLTTSELMGSADASLQVDELEGTLPHIVLDNGAGPLTVRAFSGRMLLRGGKFEIASGQLESPRGLYQLSGTASLGGVLNLKLKHARAGGFTVVGPLSAPTVSQAAEARAALKP